MPKRENSRETPLRKPELTGAESATESSPAGAGDPPELGIVIEALIEGAKTRPDRAYGRHALAELSGLDEAAYEAARGRLEAVGVDLAQLDEAMLAYGVDQGAGPALSPDFGKALDPRLSDADRELVLAASNDPGALYEAPHQVELKLAWKDPPRKARLRAALKAVKGVSLADVDAVYGKAAKDGDGLQGQAIEYEEPAPWESPVDGAALLSELSDTIRLFVDLPGAAADAATLWTIGTHIHPRLDISTILNVTSATPRCGKSLLLEVLAGLARNSEVVSGRVTPAALYRTIEKYEPTLFLDEADTFFGDDPELRGVVNGSQRRDSAYIMRCVGDDHEPRRFRTWCPKAVSGIGNLPDTTLDRCLVIRMERRAPDARPLTGWRDRDKAAFEALARRIVRWVQDAGDAVLKGRAKVAFPDALHDRARDAWEALLATGDAAGGEWAGPGGRAFRAAAALTAEREGEAGARETLLADLRAVFETKGDPEALATGDVLAALHGMEGRPWSEWRHGKALTARGLADMLKPFRVYPGTHRLAGGVILKGYKRAALKLVWGRYGLEGGNVSVTPLQPLSRIENGDSQSVTRNPAVTDTKPLQPLSDKACNAVTDTKGGSGAKRPNSGHSGAVNGATNGAAPAPSEPLTEASEAEYSLRAEWEFDGLPAFEVDVWEARVEDFRARAKRQGHPDPLAGAWKRAALAYREERDRDE